MVLFMVMPSNMEEFEEQLDIFHKKGFKLEEKNNQLRAKRDKTIVYLMRQY